MQLTVLGAAGHAALARARALNLAVVAGAVDEADVGAVALHLTAAVGARVIAASVRAAREVTPAAFALERAAALGAPAVRAGAGGAAATREHQQRAEYERRQTQASKLHAPVRRDDI